ncbi:MAG: hypothetical protein IT372_23705 [Polyangiaceae bacterium]|nr:hypothetical protein [Polyangiaceae bacterium]
MGSLWRTWMNWAGLVGMVIGIAVVGGCEPSPSEVWLQKCEQAEARGEIEEAWDACSVAVTTDPTSKFADVAQAKLKKLQPEYDKAKKARAEKETQAAKEAEERRKAAEAEQATRIEALRRKITIESYGFERDSECTGKGLPPFRKNYSGGTYDEDELVALADGCAHLFQRRNNMNDSIFCCPGR